MRTTLIALALVASSGGAVAQSESTPRTEPDNFLSFTDYDLDGNGSVTMTEFLSRVAESDLEAARGCDTDRDGLLSHPEHEVCGSVIVAPNAKLR